MRAKLFRWSFPLVLAVLPIAANLQASPHPWTNPAVLADDQAQAGKWVGTYTSDGGGTGNVTFTLSQDDKGLWRASVTYTNQNGDQTAEIKEIQVSASKFKGKFESPDGMEITLEGEFGEGQFSGTYTVREKGSTEIAEKGTWKTKKS